MTKQQNMNKKGKILVTGNRKLTDEEASWLACAIDGEGTLKLYHKKKEGHWDGWEINAIVCNTNAEFIKKAENLLSRFGHVYKQIPDRRGKKPIYWIKLSSIPAVKELSRELLPYLIIKEKNALEILSYERRIMDKGWRENISEAMYKVWKKRRSSLPVGADL